MGAALADALAVPSETAKHRRSARLGTSDRCAFGAQAKDDFIIGRIYYKNFYRNVWSEWVGNGPE